MSKIPRRYFMSKDGIKRCTVTVKIRLREPMVRELEEWAHRCNMTLEELLVSFAKDECSSQYEYLREEKEIT